MSVHHDTEIGGRILLISHDRDEHGDRLEELLSARGRVAVSRLSLSQLPDVPFTWGPGPVLSWGDERIEHDRLAGLWRRPGSAKVEDYNPLFSRFVETESEDSFLGAIATFPVRWLTHPNDMSLAERKLVQIQAAHALRMVMPETLVTNSGKSAKAFIDAHGEVVIKPVRYGLVSEEPPRVAWTRLLTAEDQIASLAGPPVILQRRIKAVRHLRVVTVAGTTFIGELRANELDWRTSEANHSAFIAARSGGWPGVRTSALRIAERLHLGFSAQDWVVDSDGCAYFLEANPNGQWLFMDPLWHGAIGERLAAELERLVSEGP
jgi:glutathione synthase/RimK-type ligase-like ATP-grasp enzyme